MSDVGIASGSLSGPYPPSTLHPWVPAFAGMTCGCRDDKGTWDGVDGVAYFGYGFHGSSA